MRVHIQTPYSVEKNLGKAYNNAMRLIPDGDWACLIDYDVQFLTPDCGKILHDYANQNHEAGIMTCLTNRCSKMATQQLLGGVVNEVSDVKFHINVANNQKKHLYQTELIKRTISGYLMLISKAQWQQQQFPELNKCLDIDTEYSREVINSGKEILLMKGLYVFHQYRMINGVHNKTHLAV